MERKTNMQGQSLIPVMYEHNERMDIITENF